MKISIIIPAYNAEKTILRCVNSALNQTVMPTEIIVIDDGSSDNTGELLDNLAAGTSLLKIVHQKNVGVSSSRNKGLRMASGDYIYFLDSDDWLEPDLLEVLTEDLDPQIVPLLGYIFEDGSSTPEKNIFKNIGQTGKTCSFDVFEDLFCNVDIHYLWNKLFNREILQKYNIYFDQSLSLGEDLIFNLEYLKHMKGFKLNRVPLYHYSVQNQNSLSNHFYKNQLEIMEKLCMRFWDFCVFKKAELNDRIGKAISFSIKLLMNNYMLYFEKGDGSKLHRYQTVRREMKTSVLQTFLKEGTRLHAIESYKKILIKYRLFFSYYLAYKLSQKGK